MARNSSADRLDHFTLVLLGIYTTIKSELVYGSAFRLPPIATSSLASAKMDEQTTSHFNSSSTTHFLLLFKTQAPAETPLKR